MRKKLLDVIDELEKLLYKTPKGPLEIGYNAGVVAVISALKEMYKVKDDKND